MLIEQQIKQYLALNKWFQSPLGLSIAQEFKEQLEWVNEYLRGDCLLQLGNCGNNPWLDALKFNKKWIASPFISQNKINLECAFNQIPLNRNSLDCIVAPLTMEPFGASYSLIDEIDRVLKPMGYVVILSINPWSLWGGAMKLGLLDCYNQRAVKMRSPFSMNRIFLQRGYRQCSLSNFCYIPPINNQKIIKKMVFIDEVGKMLWPFPSGLYCYIAQKYEPIHPSLIGLAVQDTAEKKYNVPLQPATIVI